MVDIAAKDATKREAIARGRVLMNSQTAQAIAGGNIPKGDVLSAARIAGIMAAKRCHELVPMCHQLQLSSVSVEFEAKEDCVEIQTRVIAVDRTGVEMEALVACSVAALTIYDMCKSKDRSMVISDIALWEKSGGRSGHYQRGTRIDL